MLEKIITIGVAFLLYVGTLVSIPFKKKNMQKNCGKCILSFSRKFSYRDIAIYILAALVILLVYFFNWQLFVNIVMAGCGVFAAYTASKDITYSDLYGVYENGFCMDGVYIPFEKISSITAVDNMPDPNSVRVILVDNKVHTIRFSSESEKNVVLAKLKSLKVI